MSLHKILLMAAIATPVAFSGAVAMEPTMEPVSPYLLDDHDDDDKEKKKKKKMKERKYKMAEEMKAKKAKCEAMEGEDKAACMKKLNDYAKKHKKMEKKKMEKKKMKMKEKKKDMDNDM